MVMDSSDFLGIKNGRSGILSFTHLVYTADLEQKTLYVWIERGFCMVWITSSYKSTKGRLSIGFWVQLVFV